MYIRGMLYEKGLVRRASLHVLNIVGDVLQVGVEHGVLRGDALGRVALEHLVKQVEALLIQGGHCLLQGLSRVLGVVWLVEREVLHGGPEVQSRGAATLEDLHQLIFFILTSIEGSAVNHLRKDTADRPNIH